MSISLNKNELRFYTLIMLYPLINLWFAIITNHSAMRVVYFLYVIILITLFIRIKKGISKSFLFIILFSISKLLYDMLSYPDSVSDALEIAILLMFFVIYSSNNCEKYRKYLILKKERIFFVYCIYIIGIVVTVVIGTGISNTWNTFSLQGPYGLAHILAYEMFILLINSYLIYLIEKKKKWLVMIGMFGVLIILTTARTVLLCILVAACYIIIRKKGIKKFAYVIWAILVIIVVLRYTKLFNSVIEKTENAMQLGSATSARGLIWESSFNYFLEGGPSEMLFGRGIDELTRWNYSYINMKIQAHNDLLTVLTAFGILSLAMYIACLIRFCKCKEGIGLFLTLMILIVYNGLYSYSSLVIGLPTLKILLETINGSSNFQEIYDV